MFVLHALMHLKITRTSVQTLFTTPRQHTLAKLERKPPSSNYTLES